MTYDINSFKRLDDAVTIIAHEIKNPIAAALANLALIEANDKEGVCERYCKTIEQELYRINQLVLDLINYGLPGTNLDKKTIVRLPER